MLHRASYLLSSLVNSTRNYNPVIPHVYSSALCSLSILGSRTFGGNFLNENSSFAFADISERTFELLPSSYS